MFFHFFLKKVFHFCFRNLYSLFHLYIIFKCFFSFMSLVGGWGGWAFGLTCYKNVLLKFHFKKKSKFFLKKVQQWYRFYLYQICINQKSKISALWNSVLKLTFKYFTACIDSSMWLLKYLCTSVPLCVYMKNGCKSYRKKSASVLFGGADRGELAFFYLNKLQRAFCYVLGWRCCWC